MNDIYQKYHELWSQDQKQTDPELHELIEAEQDRQARKLIFIPSESFCINPVREALSSTFTNIYAEGYPNPRTKEETEEQLFDLERQLSDYRRHDDGRFYKGAEYVNVLECLTQKRVAEALSNNRVDAEDLHVNVQPLSGANANNAIFEAFVPPGETVMGMDLAHGGHLSHGSPFNRTGKRWDIVSYQVDPDTEKLDYNRIMELAKENQPKMIIAGFTSYPWAPDWKKFREIADECGALLLADIAHTAGLVLGDAHPSPVGIADVVNFTTHKSVLGPRGAVSVTTDPSLARSIRRSIFPGEQGGPHTNKFAAMATAFKIAQTDEYTQVQQDMVKNAKALASSLEEEGLRVPYGGTDTHLLLFDASAAHPDADHELWGEPTVRIMDLVGLVANKNTIPGDKTAADARGVRLGTPWLTQRGLDTGDMQTIAELIARLVKGIDPIHYQKPRGSQPFGKVDLDLLRSVASDVSELVDKAYAEGDASSRTDRTVKTKNTPHVVYVDDPDPENGPIAEETDAPSISVARTTSTNQPAEPGKGVEQEKETAENRAVMLNRGPSGLLEVAQHRADALLQEATTRNVLSLEPGEGHRTLILNGDDELLDEVELYRCDTNRFFLLCNPEGYQDVQHWLQGLSDGFLSIDEQDPHRQVQGPAVIRNLHREEELTAVDVIGVDGFSHVREVLPVIEQLGPGELIETDDKQNVHFIAYHEETPFEYLTLVVPSSNAVSVWNDLASAGIEPAGMELYETFRTETNRLNLAEDEPMTRTADAMDLLEERFNLNKPYFVGQEAIERIHQPDDERPTFEPPEQADELKKPALYEKHQEAGAKMTEFGGWEMPVQYEGILEEHRAVRNHAGLFDVGHMGILQVTGRDATHFLDLVTTNYAAALREGEAQYSFLLSPEADVLDDLLLYCQEDNQYFLVVNAANKERVEAWLHSVNEGTVQIDPERPHISFPGSVEIQDLKSPAGDQTGRMDLALQGPASFNILSELVGDNDKLLRRLNHLSSFHFLQADVQGIDLIISNTGYTGEKEGFELYVDPEQAEKLWDLLLDKGKQHGLQPAGLGARDTLRTEAGLPLHGHDLNGKHNISPIGAGYEGFIKWHKPYFIGRPALAKEEEERTRTVVRFRTTEEGRPVREGDAVADPTTGRCLGVVTSALVKRGEQIGLALVEERESSKDTELAFVPQRQFEEAAEPDQDLEEHLDVARSGIIISRFLSSPDGTVSWEQGE